MATKVINIRNKTGQPHEVYIGRGSLFGNPFRVGAICPLCGQLHRNGGSTLDCFTDYFQDKVTTDPVFAQRCAELKGKTLVCFCKPKPCHGDIIAAYADAC